MTATGGAGAALDRFRTAVHIEVYRVKWPECGVKKAPRLPGTPFGKRFEGAAGQACEGASARRAARRSGPETPIGSATTRVFFSPALAPAVAIRYGARAIVPDLGS